MGDTVNLRQWKKRRARSEAEAEAAAAGSRAVHGLPKLLKHKLKTEAAKSAALLDGKKLDAKSPA
jgi:Domain of unknown function (DUF4169)